MQIVIIDLSNVTVDGKPIGSIVDVLTQNESLRGPVFDVLLARDVENLAAAQNTKDLLTKVKEAFNAGDFDSAKAILNPAILDAEQSEKERQIKELTQMLADIQAKIDELNASAAVKP